MKLRVLMSLFNASKTVVKSHDVDRRLQNIDIKRGSSSERAFSLFAVP
jgi:hypothetical protein